MFHRLTIDDLGFRRKLTNVKVYPPLFIGAASYYLDSRGKIMNQFYAGEAVIHYGLSDFTIIEPGNFVKCATTGDSIPIDQLRYWSHERQEAYKDAAASLTAFKKAQ